MESLIQDVRYAIRALARDRAFAITTVLTLALGIGANVAIFGVVNAVLLRPLPFREPDQLVRVFDDAPGAGARDIGMSVPELIDLGERAGVFEQLSALVPVGAALTGGDRVERIELLGTSANYFELLGVKAALGQVYGQSEWRPGFLEGVVLSDGLWRRRFGADPNVIARRIRLDQDPYTIVGVLPPAFRHPGNTLEADVDIWAATGWIAPPFPSPPVRGARFLPGGLGRLKPGITPDQANQRLETFAARLRQAYPSDYPEQQRWSVRHLEQVRQPNRAGEKAFRVLRRVRREQGEGVVGDARAQAMREDGDFRVRVRLQRVAPPGRHVPRDVHPGVVPPFVDPLDEAAVVADRRERHLVIVRSSEKSPSSP